MPLTGSQVLPFIREEPGVHGEERRREEKKKEKNKKRDRRSPLRLR
jgi:hypothetical protein